VPSLIFLAGDAQQCPSPADLSSCSQAIQHRCRHRRIAQIWPALRYKRGTAPVHVTQAFARELLRRRFCPCTRPHWRLRQWIASLPSSSIGRRRAYLRSPLTHRRACGCSHRVHRSSGVPPPLPGQVWLAVQRVARPPKKRIGVVSSPQQGDELNTQQPGGGHFLPVDQQQLINGSPQHPARRPFLAKHPFRFDQRLRLRPASTSPASVRDLPP